MLSVLDCFKTVIFEIICFIVVTDLCSPDPCKYGTHCLQTDEESYQCVKNLCTPTPCHNGGKCIVVNDESYECACQRGWKGKNCIGKLKKVVTCSCYLL